MISKINHCTIYVLDQDSAFDFYVHKLGFKVNTDVPMGPGMRWLTVNPPQQPELELILAPINDMMFKDGTAEEMKELVKKGCFGSIIFECDDLQATYEEMKAKGVEFKKPPTKEFYGYEALFSDDSGNWFSLGERKI